MTATEEPAIKGRKDKKENLRKIRTSVVDTKREGTVRSTRHWGKKPRVQAKQRNREGQGGWR